MAFFCYVLGILLTLSISTINCLYPRESLTREVKSLDGIWLFKICKQDDQDVGFKNEWYKISLDETGDVIPMAVPSSFNDITQNRTIRDYLGWSWYEKTFFIHSKWKQDSRLILRFGSAHYYTIVYMNGNYILNHTGGHLPFEADVTSYVNFSGLNRITVALNNTLSDETIPQGSKTFKSSHDAPYPPGFYEQGTEFDFFNYAGIHRSVVLYSTPKVFIDDVTIVTERGNNNTGIVFYNITVSNTFGLKNLETGCSVAVLDRKGKTVATGKGCNSSILVKNAQYWWPYGMHDVPGYLYTLHIQISWKNLTDEYYQPFGIRTVMVTDKNLLLNGKPVYLMGFGKHEDSNIRGKGVDLPLILKDFNLIKWIGANSFRTSHYPYADEIMDRADAEGIMVIDECPAVGLKSFGNKLLQHHKDVLTELFNRDKNRPSVIAWSVANEPSSNKKEADKYFQQVVGHIKSLDSNRPVTAALNADYYKDKAGKYLDFVMLNHYFSWYSDTGYTEVIKPLLVNYMSKAYQVYKKPIMMSEYGGDTIAGLHMDPPFVFTEDYQTELMMHHHEAFDILREKQFFVGEHIWNFADFLTLQQVTRVVGNKKGIFTRERQPKASAKLLRCRYHKLMNKSISGSIAYCPAVGKFTGNLCNLEY